MAFDGGAVVRSKDICTVATFAATRVEIVPSGSAKFAHRRAAEVGKRGDAKVTAAMPRATGSMPARGLAASTSTAGQPVLADGNAVIHEVGKRGVAKVYGGDAARCGQYAGGGAWWSAPARRASRYWRMETQLSPRSANAALQRLRRRYCALRAVCRRWVLAASVGTPGEPVLRIETQLSPRSANAALQRLTAAMPRAAGGMPAGAWRPDLARRASRCWRMDAVIPEGGKRGDAKVTAAMPRATGSMPAGGLAASVGTPGEPVLADGNEVIPEVGKRGDAKTHGGDAARCGQYAGGGLAASVGTAGQPVLADGNEVIPGNGGDALRFARIIPRPFRAIAHNGVRISPRLAAVIPYFPAAFNRPCCNPNFA